MAEWIWCVWGFSGWFMALFWLWIASEYQEDWQRAKEEAADAA